MSNKRQFLIVVGHHDHQLWKALFKFENQSDFSIDFLEHTWSYSVFNLFNGVKKFLILQKYYNNIIIQSAPFYLTFLCLIIKKKNLILLNFDLYPDIFFVRYGFFSCLGIKYLTRAIYSYLYSRYRGIWFLTKLSREKFLNQYKYRGKIFVKHIGALPFDLKKSKPKQKNIIYSGNYGVCHDVTSFVMLSKYIEKSNITFKVRVSNNKSLKYIYDDLNNTKMVNINYSTSGDYRKDIIDSQYALLGLKREYNGLVFPSKIYDYLMCGCILIVCSSSDCELAKIIKNNKLGLVVENTTDEQKIVKQFENTTKNYIRISIDNNKFAKANYNIIQTRAELLRFMELVTN